MYKFMIAEANKDYEIYVDLILSPAGHYLSRRPYVIGLLKELLTSEKLSGDRVVVARDMGRSIGTTDIISTSTDDTIYYAQPLKSDAFSRFAKNRHPQPSNMLTAIVERDMDGNYEICNAWIGAYCPGFPGDKDETDASKEFWQTHALAHESRPIQSKSITKVCPY